MGNHGGGAFSRRDPYRATDRPAGRSVRRCRCSGQHARGVHGPQGAGTGRAIPVVSAIGAAIALQLMPGYLQAPDRGGHPFRCRRITAGQPSALKVGTAGQLADFCPLAAAP